MKKWNDYRRTNTKRRKKSEKLSEEANKLLKTNKK